MNEGDKLAEAMGDSMQHKEGEGLDLEPPPSEEDILLMSAGGRARPTAEEEAAAQAWWDALTPEQQMAEKLATAEWRAEMAQRREHFLEEKRNEAEQKALMLQVEIADLKTKIEKLEWHNADLQKRNDGQAEDLKERDDEMLKDVLFAELKSNVAFYKAESEKRGNVIEKILAEESKKSEGGWLFFPTEDGIRVKSLNQPKPCTSRLRT